MKKVVFFTTIIASLIIINNLIQSIYSLWHKKELLVTAQTQLEKEKERNRQLSQRFKVVQSQEFIEEEARNKLFLGRPGESQVIIPQSLASAAASRGKIPQKPNWKLWWELFFASKPS